MKSINQEKIKHKLNKIEKIQFYFIFYIFPLINLLKKKLQKKL